MARSRNIKPGFFANDALAELPALTRLLFIALWTLADRDGRIEDRPKRIKAEALPYDDCDVNAALQTLHDAGFILRYTVGDVRAIQVVNWVKHQNPHVKEAESTIPAPDKPGTSTRQAPDNEQPKPERAGLIPDSLNLIPDSGFPSKAPAPAALSGVDPQVAKDWQALRKSKKAPVTETAIAGIKREADKAGLSLQDALALCCQRGWVGFKAEWTKGNGQGAPPGGVTPYQQMQIEKHAERKRFSESMRRSRNEPTNRTPIDITPERVD